ncbi:MAG TPA: iron-containing redox enzyme family protein [Polyangiaceae bacterium]|jgi:hypothetical protein|nr:iron-containing redox enzyme family protein [Polyangiaceae bacterium]
MASRSNLAVANDTTSESEELHRKLAVWNRMRLEPTFDGVCWEQRMKQELSLRTLEGHFIETERVGLLHDALVAPEDADGFVRWFETLTATGPGQNDPLFAYLATRATLSEMKWFLAQEVSGEAGFDDLVALTQVKLPVVAKLELARNYWDEMGQGRREAMHGPMLAHLARSLELATGDTVWESLALGNLMVGLAANRHYAYQSIGALGVVELTAPGRAEKVNAGLKRLGVAGDVRRYFALHATLDVRHSETWNREVLRPLVAANPRVARPIAEGALMRLTAGARCFERYRFELGVA